MNESFNETEQSCQKVDCEFLTKIIIKILTSMAGEAMSTWIHTPGKSEPRCEWIKRPAQEQDALSGF